jgi:hypothetical protein
MYSDNLFFADWFDKLNTFTREKQRYILLHILTMQKTKLQVKNVKIDQPGQTAISPKGKVTEKLPLPHLFLNESYI